LNEESRSSLSSPLRDRRCCSFCRMRLYIVLTLMYFRCPLQMSAAAAKRVKLIASDGATFETTATSIFSKSFPRLSLFLLLPLYCLIFRDTG
jgi:hypothetical protein